MRIQSLPIVSSFLRSAKSHLSKKDFNRIERLIVQDYQGFLRIVDEFIKNRSE